jgi:hypothetical protein
MHWLTTHTGMPRARRATFVAALAVLGLAVAPSSAFASGPSISGTVTNGSVAVANVEVDLYDPYGDFLTSSCTLSDGSYSFSGLAPGDYHVGFSPSTGASCGVSNYVDQFYDARTGGSATLTRASEVVVASGETTANVDATLSAGGTIAGTVENGASQQLTNIEVDLYTQQGVLVESACTAPTR